MRRLRDWLSGVIDPRTLGDDLETIYTNLIRRGKWRKLGPDILRAIFQNTQTAFETQYEQLYIIRDLVLLADSLNLPRRQFRTIVQRQDRDLDVKRYQFALTFYWQGSQSCKNCYSEAAEEAVRKSAHLAIMGFRSAVACDRHTLPAYTGLAHVFGQILGEKEEALVWCKRYKDVEDRLVATPEAELEKMHVFAKAARDLALESPEERRRQAQQLMAFAPGLLKGEHPEQDPSGREQIEEIEKSLLAS